MLLTTSTPIDFKRVAVGGRGLPLFAIRVCGFLSSVTVIGVALNDKSALIGSL